MWSFRGSRLLVLPWVLALGLLLGACRIGTDPDVPVDPRAYAADSGAISLEEGLQRGAINLPSCMEDDLRYALIDNGFGYYYDVYLMFRTTEPCMNSFLQSNRMHERVTQATLLGGAEDEEELMFLPPWSDEIIDSLGWKVGPNQTFQEFSVTTPSMYPMKALVQHLPESSGVRAYVYAYRGG